MKYGFTSLAVLAQPCVSALTDYLQIWMQIPFKRPNSPPAPLAAPRIFLIRGGLPGRLASVPLRL